MIVFILGVARTGSKIYKNILNENSDIDIIEELQFLVPAFIRKDVYSYMNEINVKNKDKYIEELLCLFYSKNIDGPFWLNDQGIGIIEKSRLRKQLRKYKISIDNIMRILMYEHAKIKNKKNCGAKFPVNIAYSNVLYEMFPNEKYIHIIRDPRAIYPSMLRNHISYFSEKNRKYKYLRPIIPFLSFIYLIYQYKLSYNFHITHNGSDNYHLQKFEILIIEPKKSLLNICEFLDIEFKESMLYPPVVDSSYNNKERKRGFDKKTLIRWKSELDYFIEVLITMFLKKEMKYFGYCARARLGEGI